MVGARTSARIVPSTTKLSDGASHDDRSLGATVVFLFDHPNAVKCVGRDADVTVVEATTLTRSAPEQATPDDTSAWWIARPILAFALRLVIFVVPVGASVLATYLVARQWKRPAGFVPSLGWWIGLVVLGTLAMFVVDRAARRLLPLATLLRMTLVFPDEKPSRFGVALRTGTTKQLERRLEDVQQSGLGSTERIAAVTLLQLVAALQLHDRFTRGHGERVRAYSALIGEELGLDPVSISKLQWAGLIHDVGKIAVPAEILNQPGRLTDEEFEIIKTHPAAGMALVGPLTHWLGEWVLAVGEHHERWDGTGYPARLAGTEISLAGRIVAVADVFDVITAARSYKAPKSPHEARAELARHAGSQFDPEVVRCFLSISLGRLRRVMWPLSWIANVPILGSSITSTAASWIAPALLAVSTAVAGGNLGSPHPDTASDPARSVFTSEDGGGRSNLELTGLTTSNGANAGEPTPVPIEKSPAIATTIATETTIANSTIVATVATASTNPTSTSAPVTVSPPTTTGVTVTTVPITIPITIPITVPITIPPVTITIPPVTTIAALDGLPAICVDLAFQVTIC